MVPNRFDNEEDLGQPHSGCQDGGSSDEESDCVGGRELTCIIMSAAFFVTIQLKRFFVRLFCFEFFQVPFDSIQNISVAAKRVDIKFCVPFDGCKHKQ